MRSSKSRSRSKQNRSRTIGNIVNRVFDSSGPEGKVRGTPQQIIDKYNQLARDASLANDRVAAENFQQHSEHYTRLLGEALRELDAQRQSGQGGQPWPQGGGYGQNGGSQNGAQPGTEQPGGGLGAQPQGQPARGDGRGDQPRPEPRGDQQRAEPRGERRRDPGEDRGERQDREPRPDQRPEPQSLREPRAERGARDPGPEAAGGLPAFVTREPAPRAAEADPLPVAGNADEADSGLVETPESAPKPKAARARKPRAPKTAAVEAPSDSEEAAG